jgi:hypothetical protein
LVRAALPILDNVLADPEIDLPDKVWLSVVPTTTPVGAATTEAIPLVTTTMPVEEKALTNLPVVELNSTIWESKEEEGPTTSPAPADPDDEIVTLVPLFVTIMPEPPIIPVGEITSVSEIAVFN